MSSFDSSSNDRQLSSSLDTGNLSPASENAQNVRDPQNSQKNHASPNDSKDLGTNGLSDLDETSLRGLSNWDGPQNEKKHYDPAVSNAEMSKGTAFGEGVFEEADASDDEKGFDSIEKQLELLENRLDSEILSKKWENLYEQRDKIAEDYDSKRRENSIWNRSGDFYSIDPCQSYGSEHKNGAKSEKTDSEAFRDSDRNFRRSRNFSSKDPLRDDAGKVSWETPESNDVDGSSFSTPNSQGPNRQVSGHSERGGGSKSWDRTADLGNGQRRSFRRSEKSSLETNELKNTQKNERFGRNRGQGEPSKNAEADRWNREERTPDDKNRELKDSGRVEDESNGQGERRVPSDSFDRNESGGNGRGRGRWNDYHGGNRRMGTRNGESLEPVTGAKNKRGEPLSLAEELVIGKQFLSKENQDVLETVCREFPEIVEKEGEPFVSHLQKMSMQDLVIEARRQNLQEVPDEERQNLIFRLLKERIRQNGLMFGEGTLEILPDEFGFLRSADYNYLSCPDDIYISPSQIRRFGLRNGLVVSGQIRPPKEKERYFALLRVEAINGQEPNLLATKPLFDHLTAVHPDERIVLETKDGDVNTRVVDLIVPVGFGQRGLIVSPPRAGKTILVQKMAQAVLENYPDSYVFMLLVDERPEEVTDMERQIKGTHCEVISSTFDEPPARHIQVAEMVLEKAKRMVEYGRDVVIFLDSITRLARAFNSESPTSGKTLSGGVEAGALQRPKKFFGAARKVEEGGSLTIIATALIDTGSRMDEVIFEEFKGTGNLEIWLDRTLVEKRIWPAIDISRSGTRREEVILESEEYQRICVLRRIMNEMSPADAMDDLTKKLAKTQKNAEFLMSLNLE